MMKNIKKMKNNTKYALFCVNHTKKKDHRNQEFCIMQKIVTIFLNLKNIKTLKYLIDHALLISVAGIFANSSLY